jgi:cell division protease FtsH
MIYYYVMNHFLFFIGALSTAVAFIPIRHHLTHKTPVIQMKNSPYGNIDNIPLSDIYKELNSDASIYISNDLNDIYIKQDEFVRTAHSSPILSENLVETAIKNNVRTSILEPSNNYFEMGRGLITGVIDFAVIYLTMTIFYNIFVGFFRNPVAGGPGGSLFPFNFPSKDVVNKSDISVRMTDWAGSPEVFEECFEIVSYIKNSTIYEAAGATIPKGVLLDGPPGTGKTLLAKAIAGETNATFLSISGSEFVELFVGAGALKVRSLFQQARENVPAIIFIDEIDAVGKKRSAANNQNPNDEREQTLNQILAEMDGFQPNTGVIVIAATNRRDVLDDALLRPGRFDRLIYVPLPDRSSRESILRVYLKNKNITADVDVSELAEGTAGFSGAQIKNLLNEAAILAARGGFTTVSKENIDDALEKIVVGITKRRDMRSIAARTRVAIHELGHAILVAYFSEDFELKKVSMKSTYNGVGGFTLFGENPEVQEAGLYTRDLLIKKIIIAMGGKAAETLSYGVDEVSVGASQDLKEANELARQMVERFGMGNSLSSFARDRVEYSDGLKQMVDFDVLDIVEYCFTEAKKILTDNKDVSDRLLIQLLESNVLDGSIIIDAIH